MVHGDAQSLHQEIVLLLPHQVGLRVQLTFAPPHGDSAAAVPPKRYRNQLAGELRFLVDAAHFAEPAHVGEALVAYLLSDGRYPDDPARRRIEQVTIVQKNGISQGFFAAGRAALACEATRFGRVYIVFEDHQVGIYRLVIGVGRSIVSHVHQRMDERELVLSPGLFLQGRPIAPGISHHWPRDFPHRYDNVSTREQVVLCIDHPPFIPDDEEEVTASIPLASLGGKRRQRWWR